MSARERSGWRDMPLSLRHRDWGFNCPMADLDFIVSEYDSCEPVALVDYKLDRCPLFSQVVDKEAASWRNYYNLARRGEDKGVVPLPFFVVSYLSPFEESTKDYDGWYFRADPGNDEAVRRMDALHLPVGMWVNEKEYVAFLYSLRGRCLDDFKDGPCQCDPSVFEVEGIDARLRKANRCVRQGN